jgi:hypothetical protein
MKRIIEKAEEIIRVNNSGTLVIVEIFKNTPQYTKLILRKHEAQKLAEYLMELAEDCN